ncbi:MAG: hypothetical protein P4L50_10300 [Anaerolineaceae bacterium]|nr:hypothetical protein [Anaerolineaceae bacterium]
MKQDRFLLGIVVGIAVVIVAALALFFLRRSEPEYGPETTPEGVVHNYVVALQKGDYNRGLSYLSNTGNKPDIIRFRQGLLNQNQNLSGYSLQIGDTQITGDSAIVVVNIMQAGNGLFGGSSDQSQNATLVRESNSWKISAMPYPYWSYDWYQPTAPAPKSVPPG